MVKVDELCGREARPAFAICHAAHTVRFKTVIVHIFDHRVAQIRLILLTSGDWSLPARLVYLIQSAVNPL